MNRRARWTLLALFVPVTFLSFPHPVADRVVDLGWALGWLGPALLILGLDGLSPRQAGRHAFLAGLGAATAILHWIYVVTVVHGHAPVVLGMLAPVALASYLAAFTAAFGSGWVLLRRRGLDSPLAAALLWTALEHGRSFVLSGFPWATLGYAQHQNLALLGLAPWAGVYGLSFVTVLGGAALAQVASSLRDRRSPPPGAWVTLAVVVALHPVGLLLRAPVSDPQRVTVRIAALQGNIDQKVKWSPEWVERTLEVYERLSRESVAQGAQIVVWPETAVPGSIESDPLLRARLTALARETGAAYLVGGVGIERDPHDDRLRFYDSAFVVDARGTWGPRYDKSRLVPFGEFLPLRSWLGVSLRALASGISTQDVSPGDGPRSLSISLFDPVPRSVMVGAPICYELLFPDSMRRFVGEGAEVLLALTNDAWYGKTGAPYQFLAITALRSAETGVWTVRSANTGVSAIIDGRGRVRKRTGIFERGYVVADVPLVPANGDGPERGGTFYVRHGDVLAWSCWVGTAALMGWARWRPPQRNES